MPYIKEEDRKLYDQVVFTIENRFKELNSEELVGHFNYLVSTFIAKVLENKGVRYHTVNGIMGFLSCSALELYRRVISPYEDEKIKENGDVYHKVLEKILKKTDSEKY